MSNKCSYFDRGFCKLKNACTKKHPSQDCGGQCDDIISCPCRHRMECKNKRSCLFVKSNSCEYLHTETWEEELQISEEETLFRCNLSRCASLVVHMLLTHSLTRGSNLILIFNRPGVAGAVLQTPP